MGVVAAGSAAARPAPEAVGSPIAAADLPAPDLAAPDLAAVEREAGGVLHDGVGVGRHAREHVLAGARVRREERL